MPEGFDCPRMCWAQPGSVLVLNHWVTWHEREKDKCQKSPLALVVCQDTAKAYCSLNARNHRRACGQ
eukprot:5542896-Prorocentrum_lima.AAC.1